jgi:hypothetical protein
MAKGRSIYLWAKSVNWGERRLSSWHTQSSRHTARAADHVVVVVVVVVVVGPVPDAAMLGGTVIQIQIRDQSVLEAF